MKNYTKYRVYFYLINDKYKDENDEYYLDAGHQDIFLFKGESIAGKAFMYAQGKQKNAQAYSVERIYV